MKDNIILQMLENYEYVLNYLHENYEYEIYNDESLVLISKYDYVHSLYFSYKLNKCTVSDLDTLQEYISDITFLYVYWCTQKEQNLIDIDILDNYINNSISDIKKHSSTLIETIISDTKVLIECIRESVE